MLHFRPQSELTRQAVEENLSGGLASEFVIVGKHRESKLLLEERVATNDAQVIEGNRACQVESDEDVAAHFFNRLWMEMREKYLVGSAGKNNECWQYETNAVNRCSCVTAITTLSKLTDG